MRFAAVAGLVLVSAGLWLGLRGNPASADGAITISARMEPPRWAILERQLLAANVPASREFFDKYFDARGYLQCFVRWGANDGPDDAFENFNRWPELHALGASDEILQMYRTGHEGLLRQYTEARTTEVPIARGGMYHKDFVVQSDWMHHGEGLQLFNRMGLSVPEDAHLPGAGAPVCRVLYGRGSRGAELRPGNARSSAACRTAAAGRCCGRRRRSIGSAIRST